MQPTAIIAGSVDNGNLAVFGLVFVEGAVLILALPRHRGMYTNLQRTNHTKNTKRRELRPSPLCDAGVTPRKIVVEGESRVTKRGGVTFRRGRRDEDASTRVAPDASFTNERPCDGPPVAPSPWRTDRWPPSNVYPALHLVISLHLGLLPPARAVCDTLDPPSETTLQRRTA